MIGRTTHAPRYWEKVSIVASAIVVGNVVTYLIGARAWPTVLWGLTLLGSTLLAGWLVSLVLGVRMTGRGWEKPEDPPGPADGQSPR